MIKNLSVLMTTYNCGKYLLASVNSILQQSFKEFEFVIIDDGSTDDTEQIISRFVDERIRYIKIPHLGRSKALNIGLRECSDKWVALMDADDVSHPQRLQKQLNSLVSTENAISCTWSAYFRNRNILYRVETPCSNNELKKRIALHSYICNSSVIYNKNFILQHTGYNEQLTAFEDYELWLRLIKEANFFVVPKYLSFVRIREDSASRIHFNERKTLVYDFQKKYFCDLESNFSISKYDEQQMIKGWREYFYGDKKNARLEWNKIPKRSWTVRIILAYLLTFTSEKILYKFQNYRLRLRLNSLLSRGRTANKEFKKTMRTINKFAV